MAKKFPAPSHFDDKQKAAWTDMLQNVDESMLVKENLFTFEIAATLMAKFREGRKPLSATEMKELKKHLITFGLAREDGSGTGNKPKKNAKYFTQGRS